MYKKVLILTMGYIVHRFLSYQARGKHLISTHLDVIGGIVLTNHQIGVYTNQPLCRTVIAKVIEC